VTPARATRSVRLVVKMQGALQQSGPRCRGGSTHVEGAMQLKAAIVGCGQIADGHVEQLRKIGAARVVAVCDREPLMAEQLAGRYAIPRSYGDFDEMLARERPDVVHITTPPQSHRALALRAMDLGCHVYVEKPFAPTAADARVIVEHAEKLGRKLTIGYTYAYDPPALDLMAAVGQGLIGEPVHVESFFGYNLKGSYGSAIFGDRRHWVHDLPGRLLQNNIDHLLNKIVPFVSDERPAIHAVGWVQREERYGDRRDEAHDELRVVLRGEKVSAYATFSAHVRPAAHFLKVYGTRGTASADFVGRTTTLEQESHLPSAIGRVAIGFAQTLEHLRASTRNAVRFARSEFQFFAGLERLMTLFYASILDDTPPPIAHRDILRLSAWIDEIVGQVGATRGRP
jgi:predicted dehydrogenase